MERMVDGDFVVAMIVDSIGKQLKANAMACPVIASGMSPRGCDEEVSMYRFV
jgi:hypothetical protein